MRVLGKPDKEAQRTTFIAAAMQGLLAFGVPAKYAAVQAIEAANILIKKLEEESSES